MMHDDRYRFIVSYVEGMALDAVWLYLQDDAPEYFERKALFLWVVGRMLDEGVICLGRFGIGLHVGSREAVGLFENAFPLREIEIDHGVWFLGGECPAEIGWIGGDGRVYWA
ncbi:DUF596 domain-containing protein [Burkholderia sp. Ac-20345]|uniref:DUF596 domain-containing protein n=1 Tax=Burkholderia sp. Ac-20345 TaxID=2703891 RepID=UPI00197B6539|nr:DUF596 domain-containing protein [Burkholderia sp. Ac-20345]MBN3779485.1 DUF596 domain-containing protein [Burkholderia sp. Ac-20345]